MPALVELLNEELAELKAMTQQSDDAAAVRSAMIEFLRFARRMQLKALSGKVVMDDDWQTLEALELKADHGDSGPGAH